ncbi:hypothetical protein RHMOL_Rhmol01G0289400 [Rhododendron molle]|uniref:Uncharacterized protein n=1 Tax=Rhododendron molle TaxID=49168 RepID=A0ACC0Q779_RHOML|nr:hypothetical protein RHMOL_Rhmol01G0289400 [Rhododendron molle]
MASSLLNGERAVVLLFIAPILHATPLSLLPEALSLSLLALFALVIEIFADSSPNSQLAQFKTSSIQFFCSTDLEYLRLQYWATFACGFSVLGFLGYHLWQLPNNIQPISARTTWDVKFILSCLALCGTVCCVLFATKYHIGWSAALKLLWVLSQGLATVKLIQHVVHNFPFCASIGEALLVTGGLVIYFGDMFALTFAKIHGYLSQSELTYVQYGIKRSEISIIIQGMVLGLLLFPIFLKLILPIWECFTTSAYSNGRAYHEIGKSVMFYASLASVLIVIVPLWMQIVQAFHVHPLLWVIDFVVSEPLKRLSLCIYWVAVILVSVRRFYNISKNSKIERILLRKYYHLMAVLMFLPALIFQPKFLDLAFGTALAVFLVLEIIRVWRIWPLGQLVHQFMNAFTDHRDSDLLIVSHFSLLLGCALPIWMSSGFNDRPLAPFAGILSLGIGDTMHWFSLLLAVTVSGLLEAYTAQLDNAFIPLVFYSLLCL